MIRRSSGILMPVSALPSPYGIGTLGKAAYDFVDFLYDANQSWWQMLPLGPTSYGDSPYQSFSTFAGNPYFVDLDMLIEDGLLTKNDVKNIDFGKNSAKVDYAKIYENRFAVLRKAVENAGDRYSEEFQKFESENRVWLPDYALYMAVKAKNGMKSWLEWEDEDIRLHRPEAVARYHEELRDDVYFYEFVQFLFFKQWDALRAYAKEADIGIIGDIPIYVALDSADVWADPRQFQLDEENCPKEVSGVPPDYFSKDGQLWGNPLYDWDFMKSDGYGWWIRRIEGAQRLYDVIRIDHFRGFESYWAVPYGSETAKEGRWVKGPGMDLVGTLKNWFWNIQFIAEDLGFLTDDVRYLLRDSGFPGMKILQFAFDSREPSNYLPHTYEENCVCFIGTHDNTTIMAWKDETKKSDLKFAKQYLGLNDDEGLAWGMIRGGMSSVASLFITQMQDYLELGADARMNIPSTVGGNWQWRMTDKQITKKLTEKIAETTRIYGRSNEKWLKSFYET
ncbi:MAG: 4-alpha-glucanotransferase [Clostridia bacterium]|nr:4-alpha-glucanotransferase [Clostridia bacterium]